MLCDHPGTVPNTIHSVGGHQGTRVVTRATTPTLPPPPLGYLPGIPTKGEGGGEPLPTLPTPPPPPGTPGSQAPALPPGTPSTPAPLHSRWYPRYPSEHVSPAHLLSPSTPDALKTPSTPAPRTPARHCLLQAPQPSPLVPQLPHHLAHLPYCSGALGPPDNDLPGCLALPLGTLGTPSTPETTPPYSSVLPF